MIEVDTSDWVASVMYPRYESKKELVKVKDIVYVVGPKPQRVRTPFKPKNVKDFSSEKLHILMSDAESSDGCRHPYYIYIGKISESLDAHLSDESRIKWPVLRDHDLSDPESSAAEQENPIPGGVAVTDQRSINKNIVRNKREAQQSELKALQAKNFFSLPLDGTALDPGSEASNIDPWKEIERLRKELAREKQERRREEENIQERSNANAICKVIDQHFSTKWSDLQKSIRNEIVEVVKEQVTSAVTEAMSKFTPCDKEYVQEWVNNIPETNQLDPKSMPQLPFE